MNSTEVNLLIGGRAIPLSQATNEQVLDARSDTSLTQAVKEAVEAEAKKRKLVN
jgi:hypothetical protein